MDTENKLKILIFNEDGTINIKQIKNELEYFQQIVEGYIQVVPLSEYPFLLVCNEEGSFTKTYQEKYKLHGTFFITKADEETSEFVSLTEEEITYIEENILCLLGNVLR